MAEDLYTKILGIPLEPRPPHYYVLLNLDLFESDLTVIRNAGMKQFGEARTWQIAPDRKTAAFALKLLNELSYAATTLEIPEKKEKYDKTLAKKLGIVLEDKKTQEEKRTEQQTKPLSETGKISLNLEQLKKARGGRARERILSDQSWLDDVRSVVEPEEQKIEYQQCPECGAQMSTLAMLCIECGYNFDIGRKVELVVEEDSDDDDDTTSAVIDFLTAFLALIKRFFSSSYIWAIKAIRFLVIITSLIFIILVLCSCVVSIDAFPSMPIFSVVCALMSYFAFYSFINRINIVFWFFPFLLFLFTLGVYLFKTPKLKENDETQTLIENKIGRRGDVADFEFTDIFELDGLNFTCEIDDRYYIGKIDQNRKVSIWGRIMYDADYKALQVVRRYLERKGIDDISIIETEDELFLSPLFIEKGDKIVKKAITKYWLNACSDKYEDIGGNDSAETKTDAEIETKKESSTNEDTEVDRFWRRRQRNKSSTSYSSSSSRRKRRKSRNKESKIKYKSNRSSRYR